MNETVVTQERTEITLGEVIYQTTAQSLAEGQFSNNAPCGGCGGSGSGSGGCGGSGSGGSGAYITK